MKIPHFLFRLINKVMVLLLGSPLHRLFSESILAIRYTGVKSGRTLTVPVRYHRNGDDIVILTSKETAWWPNFRPTADADVLLQCKWARSQIQVTLDNPNLAGPIMLEMWSHHPSDASYMNVTMRNGEPDPADFARALETAVVVTIRRPS
jgi:hypothetical protein